MKLLCTVIVSDVNELHQISIVTIVRNDARRLQRTIESVVNQTYQNIEYIIIDGKSDDGTIDTIKHNKSNITNWVSEPDDGIYDAMNKGVGLSTGDWILFLNSGHTFYEKNTIEKIFEGNKKLLEFDILYGDVVYKTNFGNIVKYSKNIDGIWKGMSFSHQSTFFKTTILKKYNYNLAYSLVSDFDLIYKLYKKNYRFKHIPLVVSKRQISGYTDSNMVKSIIQRYNIVKNSHRSIKVNIFYIATIIKYTFRKIVSSSMLDLYYKIRYRNNKIVTPQ